MQIRTMEQQIGKALYDYHAREVDEISLKKDDQFTLLQTFDDDWWMIRIGEKVGMAPSNFLYLHNIHHLSRQNSSELLRIQTMREEAAVKIDELRNTVNSYESNPLSLGDQHKNRPRSNNKAPTMSNHQEESLVVVRPPSSSNARTLSQAHQQQLIQQVSLDKGSVEYLSRIIQERINKEFATRDQHLLMQVNKMINSAISDFAKHNLYRSEMMSPSSVKLPAIENISLETKSQSDDDQHRASRKSLQGKPQPESKIPRIKLPKINNHPENRQSSSRNSKALPPSNAFQPLNDRIPSARRNNPTTKNIDDIQLDGVMYSQCRSAVSASQQDIECLKNINEPWDYNIRPHHCFGYNSGSKSNSTISSKNIFFLNSNHLIFPAASLVVVLNRSLNSQSFFLGHTEQVTCLSVNQTNRVVASCQSGSDTKIRIWDYSSLLQGKSSNASSKLAISSSVKAIGGLNFSGDGKYLLVYASEDVRSIFVLDWTKNNVLCCVKSGHPDNCEVFFDPYSFLSFIEDDVSNLSPSQSYLPGCYNIISRSARQLKVWTMKSCLATEPTKSLLKNNKHMQAIEYVLESGSLHQGNKQVEFSSVICTSTHEASSYIFAGLASGAIQIWSQVKEDTTDEQFGFTWIARGRLLMVIEKAHDSPITNFDFIINASFCKVATCDKDGVVNIWNMNTANEVSKEDMLSHADAVHIEDVGVRTLLWSGDGTELLAGTLSNNILSMSWPSIPIKPEESNNSVLFDFIVRSHHGKIRRLALNPFRNNIFATIGTDKMIKFWDSITRRFLCHLSLEVTPTTIQFSANGQSLIIGNEHGELIVLKSETFTKLLESNESQLSTSLTDWEVIQSKEFTSAADKKQQKKNVITAIACSVDGLHLAVGCKDGSAHVLSVSSNYRRIGVCKGHMSQVKNIDFSSDGRYLKSTDSSHDLLYWEVATCSRLTNIGLIKTLSWDSFTCLYGWGLQGIFNTTVEGQTEQDVNCIARTSDNRMLLAASAHAIILKKFRYPCLSDVTPEAIYGHSAPVVDMGFNYSNQLVTVGGHDCVVIVWDVTSNST